MSAACHNVYFRIIQWKKRWCPGCKMPLNTCKCKRCRESLGWAVWSCRMSVERRMMTVGYFCRDCYRDFVREKLSKVTDCELRLRPYNGQPELPEWLQRVYHG